MKVKIDYNAGATQSGLSYSSDKVSEEKERKERMVLSSPSEPMEMEEEYIDYLRADLEENWKIIREYEREYLNKRKINDYE